MSLRKLLYTPSGRAGAYSNGGYAANIFKGCTNGCKYCFVPDFLKMGESERALFRSTVTPAPNVLERVTKDLKRLGKLPEPIFLCFTCDPIPNDDALLFYTLYVIQLILDSGNAVNILTKSGMIAECCFEKLATDNRNRIGATLTFLDEKVSKFWEPNAATPIDRIRMLEAAKERGILILTWASIEPVIIPSESLRIMEAAMHCVDEFKIGRWNHDNRDGMIDWHKFAHDAVNLMEKNNKRYVLKEDLKRWL